MTLVSGRARCAARCAALLWCAFRKPLARSFRFPCHTDEPDAHRAHARMARTPVDRMGVPSRAKTPCGGATFRLAAVGDAGKEPACVCISKSDSWSVAWPPPTLIPLSDSTLRRDGLLPTKGRCR